MTEMKKTLFTAALAALLLTGCSSAGDDSSPAPEVTTAAETTETETTEPGNGDFVMRVGTDPDGEAVLTRADISSACAALTYSSDDVQEWVVDITFNDEGKEKFAEVTAQLAGTGTPLSMWVGDEMISAPTVETAITDGVAVITGNFSEASAMELADHLDPKNDDNKE